MGGESTNPPIWRRPLSGLASVNGNVPQSSGLILEPNYPDPFSSSTKIAFTLSQRSEVRLSVIDATGRETLLIPSQNMDFGRHEITWDASPFPSGVYTVRLNSGGVSTSREIVVLR